jgi:hypothetical protein
MLVRTRSVPVHESKMAGEEPQSQYETLEDNSFRRDLAHIISIEVFWARI